jgi:hypothetical protein
VHIAALNKVYCRFTVHRNAIRLIKYLPQSKTFMSVCEENIFKLWKLNSRDKKVNVLHSFKQAPLRPSDKGENLNKYINNILVFGSKSSDDANSDRFLVFFGESNTDGKKDDKDKVLSTDLFEFNGNDEMLYVLN